MVRFTVRVRVRVGVRVGLRERERETEFRTLAASTMALASVRAAESTALDSLSAADVSAWASLEAAEVSADACGYKKAYVYGYRAVTRRLHGGGERRGLARSRGADAYG